MKKPPDPDRIRVFAVTKKSIQKTCNCNNNGMQACKINANIKQVADKFQKVEWPENP